MIFKEWPLQPIRCGTGLPCGPKNFRIGRKARIVKLTSEQGQAGAFFGVSDSDDTVTVCIYTGWRWLEHDFYFSIQLGIIIRLTFIFFKRGRYTTNQYMYLWNYMVLYKGLQAVTSRLEIMSSSFFALSWSAYNIVNLNQHMCQGQNSKTCFISAYKGMIVPAVRYLFTAEIALYRILTVRWPYSYPVLTIAWWFLKAATLAVLTNISFVRFARPSTVKTVSLRATRLGKW